ncbi:hypothetical protein LEP1GSC038_3981 [Leptospira weilii str. 2006001855]|uniref:Uncharacterized protein n=2 Tax=Leptospira weilii TaxID=28184 RepID=M6Q3S5_9LEPT|nr:hypothetical protein LEP1GSC038_3981 [Leptospira weilii str. 2006001855]EMN87825.1 hypothetical protein LEP1GSC108_1121 [Leptospira weilii str. UI 13098]
MVLGKYIEISNFKHRKLCAEFRVTRTYEKNTTIGYFQKLEC